MQSIHVFVICWPGKEIAAEGIASQLLGAVDSVTVLYSTKDNSLRDGSGEWVQVPDDWYYGKKFEESLRLCTSDYMMHIHADASCDDWRGLLMAFNQTKDRYPSLGVWAPDVNYTSWDLGSVEIFVDSGQRYTFAAQTDCIVWALSRPVLQKMKVLNYGLSNLGWGIDAAAISFCYVNNLLVVRDKSAKVFHPRSTNYDEREALIQMTQFLQQCSTQELIMLKAMEKVIAYNRINSTHPGNDLVD